MYFTTRWRLVGGPKGCWTILLVKVLHYASRVKLTQGFLLKVQSEISGLKATSFVSIMFGCNKHNKAHWASGCVSIYYFPEEGLLDRHYRNE